MIAEQVRIVGVLVRRAANEILRVPGAVIPGVLAPAIFFIGLSGVFGEAATLPGFETTDYRTFIIAVGLLQGAGFTGAATGVNLARDIEQGWFDRLLLSPVPRATLLAGLVASAALRSTLPATFLLIIGFCLGVDWPGVGGLLLAYLLVLGMASITACWSTALALRFRTQQAAPLMQLGALIAILFTTAYTPEILLADWLREIANVNPVTHVLEGVRQGFVGDISWEDTYPALLAVAGLLTFFGTWALRRLQRVDA